MAFLDRAGAVAVCSHVARCVRASAGSRLSKALLVTVFLGVGLRLYNKLKCRQRRQRRQRWSQAGKDVVVLHQFERGTNIPNLSPFAVKLETFLRMANIRYIVDTEEPQGERRNKCPWITINGIELSDSELIIDFLVKHFKKPIQENLTPAQHAVGRAIQVMLDEHTIMAVAYKRYVIDNMSNIINYIPKRYRFSDRLIKMFFVPQVKKWLYIHGIGRFTEEEMLFFLHRELRVLEQVMGDKPFLLADLPSTYDAVVFAALTHIIYACAPEIERYVRDAHDSLVRYHDRMKERYWPDWEENFCC